MIVAKETRLENVNISSSIRTRQVICKISFKKVFLLNIFIEDKGQFASGDWNFCVRDACDIQRSIRASESRSLTPTYGKGQRGG
ncbi:hypothetical protein I79_005934 [Cricetulus griseus]|uniref:Uncharacterized protein n=1 Tax=Cricetulus griseus TaxID=10029 RepID=G3H6H4_CRIGR|nr:hypothetical protein I79_005934 [Cricetulus griseus]